MISLGRSLIASMNGAFYTVKRSKAGKYVDGIWQEDKCKDKTTTVFASIQPVTGDDLKRLEEGDRQSDTRKLYSADPLYTSNDTNQAHADIVLIDGKEYQVQVAEHWPNYTKAIAVRVKT